MNQKKYDKIFEKFEKVYQGIYFLHLDYLHQIKKGNLEIIIEFNKPQEIINDLSLPLKYFEIPLIYKENLQREIKTINFQKRSIENSHKTREEHSQKEIREITNKLNKD